MTLKNKINSSEQSDHTSRRDMLKRTAAATTAMGVVGTAATGNAAALHPPSEVCPEIACGPDEKKVREVTITDIICRCEPADSKYDGGFRLY